MITAEEKRTAVRLWDWEVVSNPYVAPEIRPALVRGLIQFLSGEKRIQTSSVRAVSGRYIKTRSGSIYKLGRVNLRYRRWMKKEGLEYNRAQPIKMKGGKECQPKA